MEHLKINIRKNGYDYKLVKRTHNDPIDRNIAIYAQLDEGGLVSYEVFIIPRRLKEGKTPTGVTLPPSEVFPGDRLFGSVAWCVGKDLDRATRRFEQLIVRINEDLQ